MCVCLRWFVIFVDNDLDNVSKDSVVATRKNTNRFNSARQLPTPIGQSFHPSQSFPCERGQFFHSSGDISVGFRVRNWVGWPSRHGTHTFLHTPTQINTVKKWFKNKCWNCIITTKRRNTLAKNIFIYFIHFKLEIFNINGKKLSNCQWKVTPI